MREALCSVLNSLLMLILRDGSGISDSSKYGTVNNPSRQIVKSKALKPKATRLAILSTAANFRSEVINSIVAESVEETVVVYLKILSSNNKKTYVKKGYSSNFGCYLGSSVSSGSDIWSMDGFVTKLYAVFKTYKMYFMLKI